MSKPTPTPFRRLPGRGTSLAHYHSLYLGTDCLLQVASTGWSERYKRFYYEDIRAIVIRRTTSTMTILNVLLAILALSCVAVALSLGQPGFYVGAIILALPLLYNLLAGPTCVCHIYTSVQVEKLYSLRRLRTAHKVLARLRPLIEQAQGSLPSTAPDNLAPTT